MGRILLAALLLALLGCARKPPRFSTIAEEFVLNTLTFRPSLATAAGYHRHNGVPMDELLDEFSVPALDRQRAYYQRFKAGLRRDVRREKLAPEDQIDFDIVQQQIALGEFSMNEAKDYARDPLLYTGAFGTALFVPYSLEYAPEKARFYQILKRLERFRSRVEQAKDNLREMPPFWIEMARAANRANRDLIQELRAKRPAEMSKKFDAAAEEADHALADFDAFLAAAKPGPAEGWRLGPTLYAKKLALEHGRPLAPAALKAEAEAALLATQQQMAKLAGFNGAWGVEARRAVLAKLDQIATEHAPREQYFAQAEADLAEALAFVRAKDLLPLGDVKNLRVIATPAFQRGIYGVGGFNPAPAMQPELGAQYWLTPIPSDWPAKRAESKLREYNRYGLKLLTIHEAMPGHYVQFEAANRLEPRGRRLLRSVYANGAFAEGWAVYATEMMLDAGYLEANPGLRLTFLKQQLRAISNAILDIRLHTENWSEAEALRFLVEETFQEEEEARAKLQRAKLSSVQLTTYFAGYRDFRALREKVEKKQGAAFRLKEFHRAVLGLGAIPLAAAEAYLLAQ
ncbi:MAG: DUF885 domain-containing protein [Bryobacter sp.]